MPACSPIRTPTTMPSPPNSGPVIKLFTPDGAVRGASKQVVRQSQGLGRFPPTGGRGMRKATRDTDNPQQGWVYPGAHGRPLARLKEESFAARGPHPRAFRPSRGRLEERQRRAAGREAMQAAPGMEQSRLLGRSLARRPAAQSGCHMWKGDVHSPVTQSRRSLAEAVAAAAACRLRARL